MIYRQNEFLRDLAALIKRVQKKGWIVTGGELWRTRDQQQVYVITGKSRTMDSLHLKRLAIDLNFFKVSPEGTPTLTYDKKDLQPIGDYWESLHPENRWGGNWKSFVDTSHFERKDRP